MKKGLAVSPGIGIGRAYIIREPEITIDKGIISQEQVQGELDRLSRALDCSRNQVDAIYQSAVNRGEKAKAEVLEAHVLMLDDPMLVEQAIEKIRTFKLKSEYAFSLVIDEQIEIFKSIEDPYIRERINDVRDIGSRVVKNLTGVIIKDIASINEEVILVGKEITPSQMAAADSRFVKGIASEVGGATSHTAILARSGGIPAVMGVQDIAELVEDGQQIAVDGTLGAVELELNEEKLLLLREKMLRAQKIEEELSRIKDLPAVTKDGHAVRLECNIEGTAGIKKALEAGAEGIGLFRTEFLFMDRSKMPNEEEQFRVYREVASDMGGRPVIIRTLDIGGDKEIEYLKLPAEANPFLGFRAIRLCFERIEMFRAQLRAILRASVYGKVKIMYPMIATVDELRRANNILNELKRELESENKDFDKGIEVGVMIEIPAAAVIADVLAKETDFFSIGTNDLTQYTLAVDRTNEKVSYLYNNFDPSVIRLISTVIKAGHEKGRPVGMCGELAGNPTAALLLLGLGLDEFSMSPTMVLKIKKIINTVDMNSAREASKAVLAMESALQIEEYLAEKNKELGLEYLIGI
ncbi:MAG TPA: phosphoenolpyruvate--protein phosphotransferase [Clostridia bacterium]|nr:phosphoenolpyruvate--protein phosphotransferase [Clostridia bacterium]